MWRRGYTRDDDAVDDSETEVVEVEGVLIDSDTRNDNGVEDAETEPDVLAAAVTLVAWDEMRLNTFKRDEPPQYCNLLPEQSIEQSLALAGTEPAFS